MIRNESDHEGETIGTDEDPIGSETRSANTGGNIPNEARSLDPDYDPGASELSEDIARDVAENSLDTGSAEDRR